MAVKPASRLRDTAPKSDASAETHAPVKRHASAKTRKAARTVAAPATLAHRLHMLLLAVQRIASLEDELCSLVHEAARTQKVGGELARELRDLLVRMPAHDYVHDLETIQTSLAPAAPMRQAEKAARKAVSPGKKKLTRGQSSAKAMASRTQKAGNTRKKRR